MKQTLIYNDKLDGWSSFLKYEPDAFCKLNNRFFSIKDGQLYLHNDESNPIRNNFYGQQLSSKISTVINVDNSEDKIFKTLVLEGTHSWETELETNLTKSTIHKNEFNQRESRFFAHTRTNEDINDFHGNKVQGIGVILSSSGTTIDFNSVSELVNVGDKLFQLNGSNNEFIGDVISKTATSVTVNAITTTPVNGYFSFSVKDSRVEGSNMRGYFIKIDLENNDTDKVELFAIESNVVKSFV